VPVSRYRKTHVPQAGHPRSVTGFMTGTARQGLGVKTWLSQPRQPLSLSLPCGAGGGQATARPAGPLWKGRTGGVTC